MNEKLEEGLKSQPGRVFSRAPKSQPNGYKYTANIDTTINIYDAQGKLEKNFTVSTPYKFNHCDFGRGFWTSTGWWTPGWGMLNSILGFFMIGYDDDATDDFSLANHRF